jgi:hypothetical protein
MVMIKRVYHISLHQLLGSLQFSDLSLAMPLGGGSVKETRRDLVSPYYCIMACIAILVNVNIRTLDTDKSSKSP